MALDIWLAHSYGQFMTEKEIPAPTSSLIRRAATTLAAWLAAYVVVTAVVTAGGATLARAPRSLQTLVISGVLVILMVNVVMPAIGATMTRLFTARR